MADLDARFAVTVYAGSSRAAPADYLETARALGAGIAKQGWVLVYGGANIGLMGACADGARAAGGRVEGVILDTFSRVAHRSIDQLVTVDNMRDRKAGLAHRGDAFVALPGGIGTLEELSEILVERQLGMHAKPLVLVDQGGFWQPLLSQLERMHAESLLHREHRESLCVVRSADDALRELERARRAPAQPSPIDKLG